MNRFKLFLHKLNIKLFTWDISIKCFYNDLSKSPIICEHIYNKLKHIIETEYDVPVYEMSLDELNKGRNDDEQAAGEYSYLNNKTLEETFLYSKMLKEKNSINILFDKELEYNLTIPRISIVKDIYKNTILFVLAHELGHHIIHMNGEEQDEDIADKKIIEIFEKHFHPVFLGIFNIDLWVYNSDFKIKNYRKHYITHYLDYINNGNELKLKLF